MKENREYENLLKQSGLKNTKHRTTILELLKSVKQPITAEQIYDDLKEKNISVNLSTVYRTLETLTDKELILKYNVSHENKTLFEYNNKVHKHYLVCMGCNKMVPVENCPLGAFEKNLEQETDFIITSHKLDLYGYCPECQRKGLIGEQYQ